MKEVDQNWDEKIAVYEKCVWNSCNHHQGTALAAVSCAMRWKMCKKTGIKDVYQNWDEACVPELG